MNKAKELDNFESSNKNATTYTDHLKIKLQTDMKSYILNKSVIDIFNDMNHPDNNMIFEFLGVRYYIPIKEIILEFITHLKLNTVIYSFISYEELKHIDIVNLSSKEILQEIINDHHLISLLAASLIPDIDGIDLNTISFSNKLNNEKHYTEKNYICNTTKFSILNPQLT
jgi:hypothetical protein